MPNVNIHEETLSNGLRLVVCENNNAPLVSVNVLYHVGSANEHFTKTGLAHLFEHLMFDNSSIGLDKQYDVYSVKAGAINNAFTTYDYTTYYITLPAHQLELGLWLEAERMREFSITQKALSTQQSVVVEEIKQNVLNQPYMIWYPTIDAAAYRADSAYSWNVYGSVEHVESVTLDDARGFFTRFYRPDNAVLTIAGQTTVKEAVALAEQQFGSIPNIGEPPTRPQLNEADFIKGVHVVKPDNVPLPAVFVAIHVSSATTNDILDVDLAASILGIGNSSMLYKQLVVKSGKASHAGAFVDRKAHGSLLIAYAYAIKEDVSADELCDEIQAVAKSAVITAEVMNKAKNRQRTAMAMELQKTENVADYIGYYTTFFNNPNEVNLLIDRYNERSTDAVEHVVKQLSERDNWVRVDIVPKT